MEAITMLTTLIMTVTMVYVAKLIADWNFKSTTTSEKSADLLIVEGNSAIGIKRAGMYLGVFIGGLGTMSASFSIQVIDQLLVLIFMTIAYISSDKLIFSRVNNSKEILKGNVSLAIAEAGLFIGTGIIAYSSFIGSGPIISSIVFFLLGQIVFLAIIFIYEVFHKKIKENILIGKTSSGILLSGLMIAIAIILKSAIIGDFVSWEEDIKSFLIMSGVGIVAMVVFGGYIMDLIFLRGVTIKEALEKDLIAPIIVLVALKIGMALLINSTIL